jgi:hypothetical protein
MKAFAFHSTLFLGIFGIKIIFFYQNQPVNSFPYIIRLNLQVQNTLLVQGQIARIRAAHKE